MRLLPLAAPLFALVVLAACSGDGLSVDEALQRMVLQPQDLPEGLEREEEGFLTNEGAAAGSAERESMLESWGRLLGFEVTYEPSGGLPVRGVDVSASLYETEAGAGDSFADAVKTAEETDWAANYSGLQDFRQEEVETPGAADEMMWLRLSGIQSAADGDDELVTDDLIFFREGRERGFLRVQAVSARAEDRDQLKSTVEGWLATLVANVENALAELGDGG